jgi:hypothetical protein
MSLEGLTGQLRAPLFSFTFSPKMAAKVGTLQAVVQGVNRAGCLREPMDKGHVMLKEVGASGQISLGKRLAGKLFDVVFHPDGRVELLPMRAVAMVPELPAVIGAASDGWTPPGGYEHVNQWALDNRAALEFYAQSIEQHGTAAEQMERFLQDTPSSGRP